MHRRPPPPPPSVAVAAPPSLGETLIEEAFHVLLQDALIQAQAEGLLTEEEIKPRDSSSSSSSSSTSSSDIKIIAPSLALYFAALQAHGHPPALAFPNNQSLQLDESNCPPSFLPYFRLWQLSVEKIQRLTLDQRHSLALLLCEKEPTSTLIQMEVIALARDLNQVALDIAQRSTFQSRFQNDVQTAIDSSIKTYSSSGSSYMAPPPPPSPSNGVPSTSSSPSPSPSASPGKSTEKPLPSAPTSPSVKTHVRGVSSGTYRPLPPPPLPVISIEPPEEETTTLMLIRETLFAALGDVLASNKDLLSLLENGSNNKGWSSRCYFASLCLAILDVCLYRVNLPSLPDIKHMTAGVRRQSFPWNEAYVRTVHVANNAPNRISLDNCPMEMSKMLTTLFRIAMFVQGLGASDDLKAVQDASEDRSTDEAVLYMNRLRRKLLGDVVATTPSPSSTTPEERHGEEHVKNAAIMINRLALSMFEIPSFRQRQTEAFAILGAITSI